MYGQQKRINVCWSFNLKQHSAFSQVYTLFYVALSKAKPIPFSCSPHRCHAETQTTKHVSKRAMPKLKLHDEVSKTALLCLCALSHGLVAWFLHLLVSCVLDFLTTSVSTIQSRVTPFSTLRRIKNLFKQGPSLLTNSGCHTDGSTSKSLSFQHQKQTASWFLNLSVS